MKWRRLKVAEDKRKRERERERGRTKSHVIVVKEFKECHMAKIYGSSGIF